MNKKQAFLLCWRNYDFLANFRYDYVQVNMVLKTPLITAQKPILDIANSTRSPLLAFTLSPIKLHCLFGSGPAGRQQPPTSACTVAAGTAFVVAYYKICQTTCSVWRAHQRAPLLRVWEIFCSSRLECVIKRMAEFTAAKCKTSEQEGQRRHETEPCAKTFPPSGQMR